MFTGLVQGVGKIRSLGNDLYQIDIDSQAQHLICHDLEIGDSVAVDGICLTVEKILQGGFTATASPETLQRTTLGKSTIKQKKVNLETSLRVGSKIGGHFVSGHVDGIGCLIESVNKQQSWEITFSFPSELKRQWQEYIAPYIVSKASIAVNGVSLTIARCDSQSGEWFTVAVIPHTYAQTNLSLLQEGDWVNLESDILGKYVDRLISHRLEKSPQEDISLDFLATHGYL
ncbi:riboflavin synthase [Cyanobacterium aponinum FACHB-4101]|uniref:riboflavin synthase n=1 Tax=Cyanobacterium aponinum TaxID=379064 RepID=UPI0016817762|nr:riboflavin synthase [Cyanobacterium aponinum]MBD2393746.1 riboflavin synthase [Cyanobacterium aponinum FACHB-4101]